MIGLVNCGGCHRHIRRTEPTCPFCGIIVTSEVAAAPERAWPSARIGRATLMVFAAAIGTTACSGKVLSETGIPDGIPPGDASMGGGGADHGGAGGALSSGGSLGRGGSPGTGGRSLGTGGRTIPAPGSGGMNFIVFYGAPSVAPDGGETNASGGASASGGTTNDADAGDAGPASGGGTGGVKGTGGTGGAFAAPVYGAPPPSK